MGDEPVPQILGGEVVQRCPRHGSCERGDIVSLIIDFLHELRQCWPVALSEESLVELAGQGRPALLRPDRGRFGQPFLDPADPRRGLAAARRESRFQSFTWASKVRRTSGRGRLRRELNGAAALIPTLRGAGRDDPRRLEPGLLGWQVGEPVLDKPFTERPPQVQHGGERCRTVDC